MVLYRTIPAYKCFEFIAGSFTLKCWTKDKVQRSVLLKMDNVAAFRYVNHLGGMRSKTLSDLVRTLWDYCLDNHSVSRGPPWSV